MHDHLASAFEQACIVWRHHLDQYLSAEPGEICVPSKPRHEATEFVIITLDHFLPRDAYVKIADGLAIAAFYEVLRERTDGHLERFSVSATAHIAHRSDAPTKLLTPPDPAQLAAWDTAQDLAVRRWHELLPRGLPMREYDAYRFPQIRDCVYLEVTAALMRRLPPSEAGAIAWAATTGGIYGAVAAMEFEDLE